MKKLQLLFFIPFILFSQNNFSLFFDGYSDYVNINVDVDDIGIAPTTNNDYSISFWMKSLTSENVFVVSQYDQLDTLNSNFFIRFSPDYLQIVGKGADNLEQNLNCCLTISLDEIDYNEWLYVTVVFNSDNSTKVYINGIFQGQGNINKSQDVSTAPLSFGILNDMDEDSENSGGNFYSYNGYLDEVTIWDISLTETQINNYMECPPVGTEDGLRGYWNFNNNDNSSVIVDLTNNYNGQNFNAQFSTEIPPSNCDETEEYVSNIGDLNCDDVVNQLDALILNNLILEIGDSPNQLQDQYPCLNENLNGLTTENIESLQEVIDVLNQFNYSKKSWQFPHGIDGDILSHEFNNSPYIVPDDSILYVTAVSISNDSYLLVSPKDSPDWLTGSYPLGKPNNNPYIFGPSDTIIHSGSPVGTKPALYGILFKKTNDINPKSLYTGSISTSTPYTVPDDSIFVILHSVNSGFKSIININNSSDLDTFLECPDGLPLIIKSGDVINQGLSSAATVNGYIVNENFFKY